MRNEPRQPLRRRPGMIFDNQIVDDARGRAKTPLVLPRPRFCSRSRSGDGACPKRRRCWSDSRREHRGVARLRQLVRRRGPTEDGYQALNLTPRPLGRDLGSAWSPKPGSEVQFLGSPHLVAVVQGGLGPARPHKPGTRSVRFRPLQLEVRPLAELLPLSLVARELWGARMNRAPADRVSHVCKSAVVWWDIRRALPFKRRWRRTRPVTGRGPFKSVGGALRHGITNRERR